MGMIQLPQLQESLLIANERLVDRARRRARLFRTGLMTSAAVVSIGGAAAAGTALWGPVLGHEDGNRPTASATPVPTQQAALLGALRRDQAPADRGAAPREALGLAAKRYVGVRLDAVRLLHRDTRGSALVLVPVARLGSRQAGATGVTKDALCVYAQVPGDAGALSCFTSTDVREGAATGSLGDLTWGLVPDGVSRVVASGRGGRELELRVAENAFTVPTSTVDPARPDVAWFDTGGATVTPPSGPMRLQAPVAPAGSRIAPGFHDCGPNAGDVVPESVACGADSRNWAPPRQSDSTVPSPPTTPSP
jgi:hypothetical protein